MCGIAGMIDWRAATSARGAALDRRSHERDAASPRSRRQRRLGRGGGRRGAGAAAARDHRSQPRRGAADAVGRPALRHHLQRRDLQLPRHPQRTRRRWPGDAQRLRHRGAAGGLRALGRGGGGRAHRRDVRLRAVGPHHAHAVAGARPARHQAALLRRDARSRAVRFAAQGISCRARLETDDRRRCGGGLSAPQLYRAAAHHLSRGGEAAARPYPDPASGARPELKCFWDARGVALAGLSRNDPAPDPRTRRSSGSTRCCAIPSSCG